MPATQNLKKVLKANCLDRKCGHLSRDERKTLEKFYTQGAGAYGSVQSLKKACTRPKKKVESF